jgi:hypothetical protein
MRASRFVRNGESNLGFVLALCVETRCNQATGCGGKDFPSCEHRSLDSLLLRLERERKLPAHCGPYDAVLQDVHI